MTAPLAGNAEALSFSSEHRFETPSATGSAPRTAAPAPFAAGGEATIGDMAREFGVTLRTLRFYEDRGLLHPRREGTARYYGGPDRFRLQMILKGKQLGFTLAEISELVGSGDAPSSSDIESRLKPTQILNQIDHLERQRGEIDDALNRLRSTHLRLAPA